MTDGREDDGWLSLELPGAEPGDGEWPALPPGHRLIVCRRRVRIAVDTPDIGTYQAG